MIRRFAIVLAVTMAAGASGCAAVPAPKTAFDPQAAGYVLKSGRNAIEGRALLMTAHGYVHTCRNAGVTLYPVNAYSRELVALASGHVSGGFAREQTYSALFDDVPLSAYSRHAGCDDDGRFRFEGVPDGQYYLVANIGWLVKSARFGGAVMKSIEVPGVGTRAIDLESTLPY